MNETAGRGVATSPRTSVDLTTYYTEAGMDYRAWSRGFNMHFGFWRWGMNPLALENMLEEMSRQVFARLDLRTGMRVLDLGCGLGAPARALVAAHRVAVTAVTVVPWQIEMARALASELLRRRKGLIAPWIGLGRRYFGYYLVTARKG